MFNFFNNMFLTGVIILELFLPIFFFLGLGDAKVLSIVAFFESYSIKVLLFIKRFYFSILYIFSFEL